METPGLLPWRLPELCRSEAALFRVSITALLFLFLFFSPDYPMAGNSSFLPRCICWWRRTCGLWHLWRQLSPGPSFTAPAKHTQGDVFFVFFWGGPQSIAPRSAVPRRGWEVAGGAGLCAPASRSSLCFVSPSSTLCSRICIYGKRCQPLLPLPQPLAALARPTRGHFQLNGGRRARPSVRWGWGANPPPSAVPFPRGPWGGRGAGRTSGGFGLNSL